MQIEQLKPKQDKKMQEKITSLLLQHYFYWYWCISFILLCSAFHSFHPSVFTQSQIIFSFTTGTWNEGFFYNAFQVEYLSPVLLKIVGFLKFLSESMFSKNTHSFLIHNHFFPKFLKFLFLCFAFFPVLKKFNPHFVQPQKKYKHLIPVFMAPWFFLAFQTGDYLFTGMLVIVSICFVAQSEQKYLHFPFLLGFLSIHFCFFFEVLFGFFVSLFFLNSLNNIKRIFLFMTGFVCGLGLFFAFPSKTQVWQKYIIFQWNVLLDQWYSRKSGAGNFEQLYPLAVVVLFLPLVLFSVGENKIRI
jgi:hypothetical protein